MEPVFIYCDKVKFHNDDYKIFKVDFSNGDKLDGIFFRKNKDYYITSMSCFITLEQDLKELKYYDDIKKISEISNKILKNGIEHLYEEKMLEVTFENVKQKIKLEPDKSKRGLSVHAVEFFDEESKTKRLVYVYSPYEELKAYGLKFENKGKAVYKYAIKMITQNDDLFLEKKLFFDKKKVIEEIAKEIDRQNTFFMRHLGELHAVKLDVTEYFANNIDRVTNFNMIKWMQNIVNFKYYFYHLLFHGYNDKNNKIIPKRRLPYLFTSGSTTSVTDQHPISVNYTFLTIKGSIDLYIAPELYARDKSIFRDLPEIAPVDVTQTILSRFRNQLNDPDFSVSKLYGFRGTFSHTIFNGIKLTDIIIPDYNISIKINPQKKGS